MQVAETAHVWVGLSWKVLIQSPQWGGWAALRIMSCWCLKSFQEKCEEKKNKTMMQKEHITAHQRRKGMILTPSINFHSYSIHPCRSEEPRRPICPRCMGHREAATLRWAEGPKPGPASPTRTLGQDLKSMPLTPQSISKHSKNHS